MLVGYDAHAHARAHAHAHPHTEHMLLTRWSATACSSALAYVRLVIKTKLAFRIRLYDPLFRIRLYDPLFRIRLYDPRLFQLLLGLD